MNPRVFGPLHRAPQTSKRPFPRAISSLPPQLHGLFAMQKVESSSPFSRLGRSCKWACLVVVVVGLGGRLAGPNHFQSKYPAGGPLALRDGPRRRPASSRFRGACPVFEPARKRGPQISRTCSSSVETGRARRRPRALRPAVGRLCVVRRISILRASSAKGAHIFLDVTIAASREAGPARRVLVSRATFAS
jgi:hypothetical protein